MPLSLFIQPANAVKRFFHVGETVDDRSAVVLQQFFLARRGLVALGAQAAVVEHRCQQSGREVIERTAQDVGGAVGAGAQFGAQGHGRQHGGAGDGDIGLRGGQLCFGPGDVRATGEQLAGHTGGDGRP
ncbi:hypothetical protein D3C87_1365300 [compost metagenome]